MLFQNGVLTVRQLELDDAKLMAKWLSDPLVLEYYEGRDNPFNLEKVIEKFFKRIDEVTRCIVEYEGKPIGYIQFYSLDCESKQLYGYNNFFGVVYGMDQFIGEVEHWNRGIGTLLVKSMVKYLLVEQHVDRIVMDPHTWNHRALRCYDKCGFKKVKLLPKHELYEGEYRDCWLIEYIK